MDSSPSTYARFESQPCTVRPADLLKRPGRLFPITLVLMLLSLMKFF